MNRLFDVISAVIRLSLVGLVVCTVGVGQAEEYDVIGDPATHVYLLPNCSGYNELLKNQNRRHFKSLWDAEDTGYVRAADCNPYLGNKSQPNQGRSAVNYLAPPPQKDDGGQTCLVLENLETKKGNSKDGSRVALNWQSKVQNICGFKIQSALLFQALDSQNEKIYERPSLVEVAEDQTISFRDTFTMPAHLYSSTARFQVAILWEEPVVPRPKRKPPVEEDD
ncbi:MAG: hypothetical protein G8345_15360 [Magnetococcales bacterium]|nr:hypothetical protein [Magnetococcales bacterium]NGZ28255.1 hypothetical protein [Magnetococcales bacterium]